MNNRSFLAPQWISTYSRFGVVAVRDFGVGVAGSATWPTANKAIYIPLTLPFQFNARRAFLANGTAVSGNFDIGIHSVGGEKVWSSGSTAQAGISALQFVSMDVLLNPGAYFMSIVLSNTTGQMIRIASTSSAREFGVQEEAAALPLPTLATFATYTLSYLPLCGLTSMDS